MSPATYTFPPLVPTDPDIVAKDIAATLQRAWDRVEAKRLQVLDAVESNARTAALARLREYEAAVKAFQVAYEPEAQRFVNLVTGEYAAGLHAAGTALGANAVWRDIDRTALSSLASDSYEDFLARSVQAGKTSEAFARAVRKVAKEEIPLQAAGGKTAVQAGRDFRRALESQFRIGAVTYRDGSVHSAREYTEMAARTKGRVAYNTGNLSGFKQFGVDYVQVFDGTECGWSGHQDVDHANGSIRTVEAAGAQVISHPNCRRSFGPRPDIRNATEAQDAEPIETTSPEALRFKQPTTSTATSAKAAQATARRNAAADRRAARQASAGA